MIRFIDTTTPVRYTSPLDTDENKTVFLITPLTSQELQVVNDATASTELNGTSGIIRMKTSLRNRLVVQLGLKGIENASEPFITTHRSVMGLPPKDVVEEALLNRMPIDIIVDLAEEIQRLSTLQGIAPKN